jgi:hypothetical protein
MGEAMDLGPVVMRGYGGVLRPLTLVDRIEGLII